MDVFCCYVTDFEKQFFVLICLQMLFEGRYKAQDLHLFSVPSFIFSKSGRGFILAYPQG